MKAAAPVPVPVLAVEGLEIATARGIPLVQGLDLQLARGKTLAIVGESGCGKSITALGLMGLLPEGVRIAAGAVRFAGEDLTRLPEARLRDLRGADLAMVFQEPMTSLNPVLTVGMQIEEVLWRHRAMTRAQARARALELLQRVQLPEPERRLQVYPHQLSGGQRQRVMIASALACQPRLLIADEPTTALDVSVQAGILALLQDLQREFGLAMLLITHDFSVVGQVADEVLVMYAGRKVEQGPARAVLGDPQHPYTQLLLRARPNGNMPRDQRLAEIAGMVAPPQSRGAGCHFAPRCPHAQPACAARTPPLLAPTPGHQVACILHDGR